MRVGIQLADVVSQTCFGKEGVGLLLAVVCLSLAACSPTILRPRLIGPGRAEVQRANAVEFDPYPPDDLGPEIVGGRPRDYAKPIDEVRRARQYNPNIPSWPAAPEQSSPWPSFAPPATNFSRTPLY